MADGTVPAIVIDNGSCTSKVGYGGDDAPRLILPSTVGYSKRHDASAGRRTSECYCVKNTAVRRNEWDIKNPIDNGIVTNWDDMEKIWHHIFELLRADTKESPIMLTEVPMNPKACRGKTTQIMFETFDVPALYLATQQVLALYASGRTTGIVFDSGDGVSHAVPIYEGYSVPHATLRFELAGSHVTEYLGRLKMEQDASPFSTKSEFEAARKYKEEHCYVAVDFEQKLSTNSLFEGTFRAPECLFKPSLIGKPDTPGIHEITFNAIRKCDVELIADLLQNIVLSGGSTLFSGMEERMRKEITSLTPLQVKVIAPAKRELAAWKGGSMLASLSTFQELWISKEEYNENGQTIVDRKCFQ